MSNQLTYLTNEVEYLKARRDDASDYEGSDVSFDDCTDSIAATAGTEAATITDGPGTGTGVVRRTRPKRVNATDARTALGKLSRKA